LQNTINTPNAAGKGGSDNRGGGGSQPVVNGRMVAEYDNENLDFL
jgi:hypothetical protein